jgi:hypothetical protein
MNNNHQYEAKPSLNARQETRVHRQHHIDVVVINLSPYHRGTLLLASMLPHGVLAGVDEGLHVALS